MDFSNLTLFSALKTKLNYISERQSVLSQNVANADTAGYKSKDVAAPDFKSLLKTSSQKLALTQTNPKHIAPINASGAFKVEKNKNTYEQSPDGNNVAIEQEMMKIGQNQVEYQKSLNLYHKIVTMFNTAVDSGNTGG